MASTLAALTAALTPAVTAGHPVLMRPGAPAFDINPIHWLGGVVADAAGNVFQTAMTALWSAGLWMLGLAFQIIDAFTTPDVSGSGPLGSVLPTTAAIGASVAVLMMSVQLATAMARRDGQSLGRVVIGLGQFALVWAGYLVVAGVFVTAASGLEHAILQQMLHVDTLSSYDITKTWPRKVSDLTVATVLGLCSLLLVIPAAFAYVLLMLVREAALLILVATSPITAAGLLAESTKAWFWKSLRWFISSLLIGPTSALVLGIGVQVSNGVISGKGDKTAAAVGTAVVGALIIAIGATSPLVLFRLLAFVEPGTASGAALRQSWSDAGGMSGLMSGAAGGKAGGGQQSTGSAAASASGADGRSGGETAADGQTQSRMAGMLGGGGGLGKMAGGLGSAARAAGPLVSAAQRAVDIGSDVLGQAGVGAPGYSQTPTDERSKSRRGGVNAGGGAGTGAGGKNSGQGKPGGSQQGGGPTAPDAPGPGGLQAAAEHAAAATAAAMSTSGPGAARASDGGTAAPASPADTGGDGSSGSGRGVGGSGDGVQTELPGVDAGGHAARRATPPPAASAGKGSGSGSGAGQSSPGPVPSAPPGHPGAGTGAGVESAAVAPV